MASTLAVTSFVLSMKLKFSMRIFKSMSDFDILFWGLQEDMKDN